MGEYERRRLETLLTRPNPHKVPAVQEIVFGVAYILGLLGVRGESMTCGLPLNPPR